MRPGGKGSSPRPGRLRLALAALLLLAPSVTFAALSGDALGRSFRNENLLQHGLRKVEARFPTGQEAEGAARIEAAFDNVNLNALAADADFEPLLPDPDEYAEEETNFIAYGGTFVDPSKASVLASAVPDVAQLYFDDLSGERFREDEEPTAPPMSYSLLDEVMESRARMEAKVGAPVAEEPEEETRPAIVERFLERKPDASLRISKKLELAPAKIRGGKRGADGEVDKEEDGEPLRMPRLSSRGDGFRWPVVAKRISSRFGWRVHPIHRRRKFHNGVDFAATYGRPIVACGEGVVEYAGWKNYYGKTVIVRHPNGLKSLYAHCSKIHVSRGQTVKGGAKIAAIGSTGLSTGPHLHFGVMKGGKFVNPLPMLR